MTEVHVIILSPEGHFIGVTSPIHRSQETPVHSPNKSRPKKLTQEDFDRIEVMEKDAPNEQEKKKGEDKSKTKWFDFEERSDYEDESDHGCPCCILAYIVEYFIQFTRALWESLKERKRQRRAGQTYEGRRRGMTDTGKFEEITDNPYYAVYTNPSTTRGNVYSKRY